MNGDARRRNQAGTSSGPDEVLPNVFSWSCELKPETGLVFGKSPKPYSRRSKGHLDGGFHRGPFLDTYTPHPVSQQFIGPPRPSFSPITDHYNCPKFVLMPLLKLSKIITRHCF